MGRYAVERMTLALPKHHAIADKAEAADMADIDQLTPTAQIGIRADGKMTESELR